MLMRLKAEYEREQLADERKLWAKQVLAKKRAALGAKTVSETTGWEIPHHRVWETREEQAHGAHGYGPSSHSDRLGMPEFLTQPPQHLGVHGYGPSSRSDRLGMPEFFTTDALAFPIILCCVKAHWILDPMKITFKLALEKLLSHRKTYSQPRSGLAPCFFFKTSCDCRTILFIFHRLYCIK